MSKIFQRNHQPGLKPKRNTFDMSFASHSSFPLGKLVPVFCKEVIPGDSVRIKPSFSLRFQPLVFPIQSKLHCSLHFFYCRNRNAYDGWMNFITRTNDEDTKMPYHLITPYHNTGMLKTGGLLDYLDVPTTLVGSYANVASLPLGTNLINVNEFRESHRATGTYPATQQSIANAASHHSPLANLNSVNHYFFRAEPSITRACQQYQANETHFQDIVSTFETGNTYCVFSNVRLQHLFTSLGKTIIRHCGNSLPVDQTVSLTFVLLKGNDISMSTIQDYVTVDATVKSNGTEKQLEVMNVELARKFNNNIASSPCYLAIVYTSDKDLSSSPSVLSTDEGFFKFGSNIQIDVTTNTIRDAASADAIDFNPFVKHTDEEEPKIKLNAIPARLYESIYNYFYRDEVVDPLLINGKPEYNKYIRNTSGGADDNFYPLHDKNWEKDYFTGCSLSPQQGEAPLVGLTISGNGKVKFTDETTGTVYEGHAETADDGDTITGISLYDKDNKTLVHRLNDAVLNGISISDFRQVNALQRWLEINIRKGMKYGDMIKSHLNVTPGFNAADVPEFIGGCHRICDINTVTNSAETENGVLGQYAGQMTCVGGGQSLHKFCDEHGYIIGIMSVYPEPIYSQTLPKHFLKTESAFDYFWPEFGHISYQPVLNAELAPIQFNADDMRNNTDHLFEPFGYQRAWADYIGSNDTIHGDMRKSLNNFVINRVFGERPQLGHDFIAVKEDDINDVFSVIDGEKCLGQFRFDCQFKRPIPRFGIPKLES